MPIKQPILVKVWTTEHGHDLRRVEKPTNRKEELASNGHLLLNFWGDWIEGMEYYLISDRIYRYDPITKQLFCQDIATQEREGHLSPWYQCHGFLFVNGDVMRPFQVSYQPTWKDTPDMWEIDWPE